jgi:hypothetical protein
VHLTGSLVNDEAVDIAELRVIPAAYLEPIEVNCRTIDIVCIEIPQA